ncbi:MAG: hypothetical protein J1E61_10820 [Lachnospiraceae bacterium]|nr:hypothetical protein [Lachnospiraceae bacterium]
MTNKKQFMEYHTMEVADLVTVFDLSLVEVHFYPYEEYVYPQTRSAVIDTVYEIVATDAYGNETIVKVQPDVVMNPRREGIPEERIYDISTWVPARDIVCVDSKVYVQLKEIYDRVDWYGEFELGDPEVYELYKKKFKELVDGERTYWDPKTESEAYIGDLFGADEIALSDIHTYYFFDYDSDNAPELMLQSVRNSYAFKYDPKQDRVTLWNKDFIWYGRIIGSRKVQWGMTYRGYAILDKNLEYECEIEYVVNGYTDEHTGEDVWVYLISLPYYYKDPEKQIELTDEMRDQCYYINDNSWYYFGVTEEQFEKLVGHYLNEAYQKAEKEKEKAVFRSYEELFGE